MRDIPNTTGSISYGETSWESGDAAKASSREEFRKLIAKTNAIPLPLILKHYGYRIDAINNKIVCPFKSHKGGRENSPSFYFYVDTNSFYCFGCKVGGQNCHGSHFISNYEKISLIKSAEKILSLFPENATLDIAELGEEQNFSEKLDLMLDFSKSVREFRQNNLDEKSFNFIEKICSIYDQHNAKRKLTNEALKHMIDLLKNKITNYTP